MREDPPVSRGMVTRVEDYPDALPSTMRQHNETAWRMDVAAPVSCFK